jgi:hypothetical protein
MLILGNFNTRPGRIMRAKSAQRDIDQVRWPCDSGHVVKDPSRRVAVDGAHPAGPERRR